MAKEKGKKNEWLTRLRRKRRYVAMDIDNFSENWSATLSTLNIITIIFAIVIIVVTITWFTIRLTPIKQLLPGFPDGDERALAIENANQVDSMRLVHERNEKWINTVQTILSGGVPGDTTINASDSIPFVEQSMDVIKSEEDSILRGQIEYENLLALEESNAYMNSDDYNPGGIYYFTPVEGTVSQSFDAASNHMGTDIVAPEKSAIKSTLDGTIIFASWTSDAGHVIQVQHSNNLISVYKHNSILLKQVGDRVKAGDPIAVIGNSGKYTTGAHLHFELWQNGKALDPQQFINF